jgi:hypothetical protein
MTEVFDAWAAERVQKQPLSVAPPYIQPRLYAPQRSYQQAQQYQPSPYPHMQPQPFQQVQQVYNYNSPTQLRAVPHSGHSYLSNYNSPVSNQDALNDLYGYRPPEAVESPVELPGATMLAVSAPAPMRSTFTADLPTNKPSKPRASA